MGICKVSDGSWAVNGVPIYTPDAASFSGSSLLSSDSKRAESGVQYLTWIRDDIRSIKLTYSLITEEERISLRSKMLGKEFLFTFPENGGTTIDAFARKDSYAAHRLDLYPESGGVYKNYTIDIEQK